MGESSDHRWAVPTVVAFSGHSVGFGELPASPAKLQAAKTTPFEEADLIRPVSLPRLANRLTSHRVTDKGAAEHRIMSSEQQAAPAKKQQGACNGAHKPHTRFSTTGRSQ